MKVNLIFPIVCGEKTCASEKGKFCSYFRDPMSGRTYCYLFGGLIEKQGWTQRHYNCLKLQEDE